MREVTIAGEGCNLVIRVRGYERPGEQSGADANWLTATVELNASTTGVFQARHDVALRTEELAQFRDDLDTLLRTLDGEAALAHMEDQLGCTIRLKAGVGEMDAFVREQLGAELRVARIRTDQSYLERTLHDVDALVATFPVRSDALG